MPLLVSLLFTALLFFNFPAKADPWPVAKVSDKLFESPVGATRMEGYLGGKIDLCIAQRIKKADVEHLVEPFRHRNESNFWQSEFWGKWMLSAVGAYEYRRDPKLRAMMENAVSKLIATQTPDGYIGNYPPETQLRQWDVWGRKYTLLGLLAYFDLTKDEAALTAARRLADYTLTQVGPRKVDIVTTGNYRGMPSSSILEPMILLYKRTQDPRYLDFAKYIVRQWETPKGPKLISKALDKVAVADRFPAPESWWSWENGQKGYEMMSCYEGLLDLYRITGEAEYLKAVELAVRNIIDTEINAAGSGTAFECFYHGAQRQTEPSYHTMETCVTMTWIKLCHNLLRLTANPMYADEIEKTAYNALLASMKSDGSQIAKYSPLEGTRQEGEEQCGMHINCCNANGPRGFVLLPRLAFEWGTNALFVNLYCESSAVLPIGDGNHVSVKQSTRYPETDRVEILLNPERPGAFSLNLRIPAWSEQTSVQVNGQPVAGINAGTYLKIHREWKAGDRVVLNFDLRGRLIALNGYEAIYRGPLLLARDSRFKDGFVDETAVIKGQEKRVDLKPAKDKPANVWLAFTAPLVLGTDLEGEFKDPRQVHFCDFASAGNDWKKTSRYRVWIRRTLNAMEKK